MLKMWRERGVNESGTGAVFRERMNLVTLTSTALIYSALLLLIVEAPTDAVRTALFFAVAIALQLFVTIGAAIVIALTCAEEPDDERVVAIIRGSTRYSWPLLTILVVVVIFASIAQQIVLSAAGPSPSPLLEPLLIGHGLLFSLVLSDIVRMLTLAHDHRRA